ncbi:DUF6944 family repetitive protein [Peribacillus sp. NPDC097264]|uniref:DUF6944 family repetitive protein n=1 Tax=Peribacillus sp. NPDC097264 TaxID=3390616 RepID=UPI003D076681
MGNQFKETFGSWVQAIGTVLSAIANTPTLVPEEETATNLDVVGNVLQGTGNAVIADGEEAFTLDQIGSAIQAIGNSTVITGLIGDFSDETKQILVIDGNFIQALGGGVSAADITENSPAEGINIVGNILQAVGNSLQALAGIIDLKSGDQDLSAGQGYGNQGNASLGGQGYGSLGYGDEGNGNNGNSEGQLDSQSIQVLGSWIQAIGAILTLIAQLISNESGESGSES